MVSIVIPVYNVSAYVERSMKSVMSQTYSDIECILVDDATQDDSIEICERMIGEYDGPIRFHVLHHQQNRGLSAARNTGTKVATGEWIYYLDSDDEITADCIEKLMKPIEEDSSIEMVQGNHIEERNGKEQFYNKGLSHILISGNDNVRNHYYRNHHICACAWNKLLKRQFVEEHQLYFKDGLLYEDRLWSFYLHKYLRKVYICNDVTYYYHIRTQSITTGANGKVVGDSFWLIYNEIINSLTYGKESQELMGYLYGFCRPYCMSLNEVPALKNMHALYKGQTRKYGCWYGYILLSAVGFARRIGNPIGLLQILHDVRWKIVG